MFACLTTMATYMRHMTFPAAEHHLTNAEVG